MKFEFDTTVDKAPQAAALAAALAVLYGNSVVEALDTAATRLEIDPRAADGFADMIAPTAAQATVQATAPAPTGQTVTVGAVDTAGLPWDERIHASTKTTNKDGTWSRRRNTPDATFDTVMAELIAARDGAPAEASAADAFADPTPLAAPAETDTAGSSTEAATVGQTAQTDASPSSVVPPPASSGNVTFPQLMVKITKAQTAGKIDKAKVDEFLGAFGLDKIAGLASAGAEVVQAVNAMVDEHVGA